MKAAPNMPISKPDILAVIAREGIELHKRGRDYWAPCPFHQEKSPSFKISSDRQRFKCFGCGEGGDVIGFIMKRHDLAFKDALVYLGLRPGHPTPINQVQDRRRRLLKAFELWRRDHYRKLCLESIWLHDLHLLAKDTPLKMSAWPGGMRNRSADCHPSNTSWTF